MHTVTDYRVRRAEVARKIGGAKRRIMVSLFSRWLCAMKTGRIQKKLEASAVCSFNKRSKSRVLASWYRVASHARLEHLTLEVWRSISAAESNRLTKGAISAWKMYAVWARRIYQTSFGVMQYRRQWKLLRKAFSNWALRCSRKLKKRPAVQIAIARGKIRLYQKSIRSWTMHVAQQKARSAFVRNAQISRDTTLVSLCFLRWRNCTSLRTDASAAILLTARNVLCAWREASSILGLEREIFTAWKASRTKIVIDSYADEKALTSEGSLNTAYSRVLEECSALESMVQKLDDTRRSELERIEQDSAMIDFTLNELGMQSAMINLDLLEYDSRENILFERENQKQGGSHCSTFPG